MGRLFLFVIIAIIAGVIAVAKSAVGQVTKNEELKNTTLKGEAKKVMDKTAKGVSWMEEQWEESKKNAEDSSKKISHDD
jgi:predicted Holliday junction resolvase-like endonuclease